MTKRDLAARIQSASHRGGVAERLLHAQEVLDRQPTGFSEPTFRAESTAAPRIISVPISLVDDNPLNARSIYNQDIIVERAASIAARGQMQPAPACRNPAQPGRYTLIDGHYRKRALLYLGRDEIELDIRDIASEIELYIFSRMYNKERGDQTALDDAFAWKKLLEEGRVAREEDLEGITGVKPAAINKCLSLLKLPEAAIEKIRENPAKFGVAIGYEIYLTSQIINESELLELMQRVIVEDLSSRELERIRKSMQPEKKRRPRETSRQYRISRDGIQIGYVKEWDNGTVQFQVKLTDTKERTSVVDDLKRKFGLTAD